MSKNVLVVLCLAAFTGLAAAQTPPPLVGLGDSLGEGVQSGDANQRTQAHGYLDRIAKQMGVPFALPLIKTSSNGYAGETNTRHRVDPTVMTPNLAVSGASSGSILKDASGTPIDDETDLVLSPQTGTQIQIAQSLRAPFMICWIGNNDVLNAVISYNHLNASQITPLPKFESNFQKVVEGLSGWGAKIVFGNIPDVTKIGFLMNNQDLTTFLGKDYGLPDGSLTTVIAMLMVKMGADDGSIFKKPNWVLDPTELQTIQNAVVAFNHAIARNTKKSGYALVDAYGLFNYFSSHPITFPKITLTNRFNGGLFSLDGAHPSDIGYALVANAFINEANSFYNMGIPRITHHELKQILRTDPFVDFDNNLIVRGRPYAGLLETLGPKVGISGDKDQPIHRGVDPSLAPAFMRAYYEAIGRDPNTPWTKDDVAQALGHMFGIDSPSEDGGSAN